MLFIAECIIQALNEGSILAMFVHTCLVTLSNANLHSCACSGTHALCALTMEVEEREERCFLTMEDAEDSAAGLPKRTCFVESSPECTRQLATLRKRKQQSQCTKEAKRARRKQEKVQKKKTHCGESSQAMQV